MQMIDLMKRLQELDSSNPRVMSDVPILNKRVQEDKVEECGMMPEMGMPMDRPSTPATINMTAGSAAELGDLLKDIVSLAGMSSSPEPLDIDMPGASDPAGVLEPAGDNMGPPEMKSPSDIMRSTIDKLNPDDDEDSSDSDKNDDEENKDKADETVNSEPNPEVVGQPPANRDQSGAPGAAAGRNMTNNPVAMPKEETTFESLMDEYKKFISEN